MESRMDVHIWRPLVVGLVDGEKKIEKRNRVKCNTFIFLFERLVKYLKKKKSLI